MACAPSGHGANRDNAYAALEITSKSSSLQSPNQNRIDNKKAPLTAVEKSVAHRVSAPSPGWLAQWTRGQRALPLGSNSILALPSSVTRVIARCGP